MTVLEAVKKVVADRTDFAPEDIKPESTFKELSIDSLDQVELLMNLEDELGVTIDLQEKVETVGDLVEYVEKNCMN